MDHIQIIDPNQISIFALEEMGFHPYPDDRKGICVNRGPSAVFDLQSYQKFSILGPEELKKRLKALITFIFHRIGPFRLIFSRSVTPFQLAL